MAEACCCSDDAKLEPHDVDIVSACEFRLLSVDMGLLESSGTLWKMLCVTCATSSGQVSHGRPFCLYSDCLS